MTTIARRRWSAAATMLAATVLALATAPARAEEGASAPPAAWTDVSARDPIEGFNRAVFRFNDTLDVYALEPAARGWNWLAPKPLQHCVTNFAANLRFPVTAINNLLQGKLTGGAVTVGRFVINSSIGFGGIFDPATEWGLRARPEDFGQTLGTWGTPPGPYLMLPLLGPSNVRDTGGRVVDYGLNVLPFFINQWVMLGSNAVNSVNDRAQILDEAQDAKAASLDYYVFVRNAYTQRRQALVHDLSVDDASPREDNLYDDLWDDDAGS
jgi:phospholipid-binding lipoprotein MlaA